MELQLAPQFATVNGAATFCRAHIIGGRRQNLRPRLRLRLFPFAICIYSALIAGAALAADRSGIQFDKQKGIWNPMPRAPDNQPQIMKVLVLNYDPISPADGHRRLTQIFNWGDAAQKAAQYKALMERASGGYLQFEIVEWRNLNELYAQEDGKRYTIEEYVRNRRSNSGWREKAGSANYPLIMHEQKVVPLVNDGLVDEVWIFSDHYFGLWEASMAGPRSFYINGGVYPQVPSQRPFALYGFNYERAVEEMAHNTSHRTEATMNRIYGQWNLKAPTSNWDKFSANHDQSGGLAGVGTCHWPANATADYDYGNPREVLSWADDFLDYPQLDGERKPVSSKTWNDGNPHRGYMRWYFAHLPRAAGVNQDGRQNNWWKYLFDFDNYSAKGQPNSPTARLHTTEFFELGKADHLLKVAYQSPVQIQVTTFGDDDLAITGPMRFQAIAKFVAASDNRNGTYRVAAYRVAAPAGGWSESHRGTYTVQLQKNAVECITGEPFAPGTVGTFQIRSAEAVPASADDDTLLMLSGNGNAAGHQEEKPVAQKGIETKPALFEEGLYFRKGSELAFAAEKNVRADEGSLEFWIQPDWDGRLETARCLFLAGTPFNNGLLVQIDGARNLRLMVWGDDPATPAVETNVERGVGITTKDWKAGQWRHVAATWNSKNLELALYIDGRPSGATSESVRLSSFSRPDIHIGSGVNAENPCLAVLDEVRISSRSRSANEIKAAYDSALGTGQLRIEPKQLVLDLSHRKPLKVLAESKGGALRDVTEFVRWKTDKADVARVDRYGTVTGVKQGNSKVTASLGTLAATAEVQIRGEAPPLARITKALRLPAKGADKVELEIEYLDREGIESTSLDSSDLRLAGPAGFHQFLTLADKRSEGRKTVAKYRLNPPEGGWQDAPGGAYKLEMKAWQVHSPDGRFVAETTLGSFTKADTRSTKPGNKTATN